MLGPADYLVWAIVALLEVCAVVSVIRQRSLKKYFTLVLYLCIAVLVDSARYAILATSGYRSQHYFYFYYYSDAVLTIVLFFALIGLYSRVFADMGIGKYLRAGTVLLLAATAGISYYMVNSSSDKFVTHFVDEISQNLYFVGVLLTYLLWAAMMKTRENRTRVVQLVLSLGIYFSAYAGSYALHNMYPHLEIWRYVAHFMSLWLPLSWAYTFVKVPEESRMATASVLVPNQ